MIAIADAIDSLSEKPTAEIPRSSSRTRREPVREEGDSSGGLTRVQQLIKFLRSREEATTREIVDDCGIPRGSLGDTLNREEFEQVRRGVWRLSKIGMES